ncbi:YlzJ-like family protein [Bacillus testis]|uniref:YlzJ-like family protein n=1 Tax=Bacillus testis TaxID=1622072 RepID=UPI00067EA9B5|nr:YlzJ-like family protein [Bacillus testis]
MTIYTILPNEWVFAGRQESSAPQANVYYKGVRMTVEKTAEFQFSIVQLHSTDPNDYLNEEFQPGAAIDIRHVELIQ